MSCLLSILYYIINGIDLTWPQEALGLSYFIRQPIVLNSIHTFWTLSTPTHFDRFASSDTTCDSPGYETQKTNASKYESWHTLEVIVTTCETNDCKDMWDQRQNSSGNATIRFRFSAHGLISSNNLSGRTHVDRFTVTDSTHRSDVQWMPIWWSFSRQDWATQLLGLRMPSLDAPNQDT